MFIFCHFISRKHGESDTLNTKIMVKLESQNRRNKCLRIAKKLRHEKRWNKVFNNTDLSVKERKMHFELRQQLK